MKKLIHLTTALFFVTGFLANAQDIVWTGSASNNDFFDEGNWKNSVTNNAPSIGVIDPGIAINLPLKLNNATITIIANGEINVGTGSLSVSMATIKAESIAGAGGSVVVNEGAYIELTSTIPFKPTTPKVQINFTTGIGWIKTTNFSARLVSSSYLGQITINGNKSVYKENLRLDNYYLKGCVIRSNEASTAPLTVYDGASLQGTSALIPVNTIHKGDLIAGAMNNKMESFLLKKGFMVTIAVENDGTGSSKNFIASESDLIINELPKLLKNSISFIRVLPWNWVTKKGRNDTTIDLNTSWRYQWNHTESSGINWEFAPMSWGHGTTTDPQIAGFIGKYGSPYIMSFNEPDDCDAQSGQYGFPGSPKLCDVDEAVRLHKNFMKTGMRIVSPGGREEAPKEGQWIKEFYDKATAQDVRIDVIAVHWYDWGSSPVANPNPTAAQVFNRFKVYLENVHNLYGLPIWITEFNANPARSQTINSEFLKLALPYLESSEFIERYCWFPYNTGTHFYGWNDATNTSNTTISLVGTVYKNQVSTPSVPELTFDASNNLNLVQFPNIALNKPATANTSFNSTYLPVNAVDGNVSTTQWFANFGSKNEANFTPLPAWIEVDLKGSYTVDSFRIVEASRAMKDFRFEYWDATLNSGAGGWSTALAVTGNPASPLTTFKSFTAVTTTKVRLYVTAHNSASYLRIIELEVFGKLAENLAVKEFEKQVFSIYPNPVTNGILNISGEQEVKSIAVYNILGAKINIQYTKNEIRVDDLAPGVYFLRVNNKYSFKFVKK